MIRLRTARRRSADSSIRQSAAWGLALAGLLASCAGQGTDPEPQPDPAPVPPVTVEAATLLREGPIAWEPEDEVLDSEGAFENSITVSGGAGGSYGGRAGAVIAELSGGTRPSPPASASPPVETEALRALGYVGGNSDDGWVTELGEETDGERAKQALARLWQRATAKPNTSRLLVGEDDSLPLEGASTEVWIEGFRARVVVDLVYRNDRDRQLEGSFQLRLPDGASPYYLAFGAETWSPQTPDDTWTPRRDADERAQSGSSPADIARARAPFWAGVKEARMVTRDRGAKAYEETVARQVDPALLEWAGAGVFRAKLFPLVPGELHRVVLGYELDLSRVQAAEFQLALGLTSAPTHPVDVHIDLPAGARAELLAGDLHQSFGAAGGVHEHVQLDGATIDGLAILVSDLATPLLVTPGVAGRGLFATTVQPALETAPAESAQRAVILLDTSRSAAAGYTTWMALLEALLGGEAAPREFALLAFDAGQTWLTRGFVTNDAAGRRTALEAARAQWLAGATDLAGALSEAVAPAWWNGPVDWDLFLLGDGASTWGEADPARITAALDRAPRTSLFAYRTGQAGGDVALLERLVRASGGAVFNVAGDSAVAAAATAHSSRPWRLVEARVDGASDLLIAGRPRFLFPGQALTVVGSGAPSAGAVLELDLERDGQVLTWRTPLTQQMTGSLAERAFGQIAVAQLEELEPASRTEAEDFALHFRVPGSSCSLLMLETEAEYEAYGLGERDTWDAVAELAVAATIERLWREAGASLADPRARLANFLERLQNLPDVNFESAGELVAALATIDPATLTIAPEPLETTRRAEDVAEAIRAAVGAEEVLESEVREATAAQADAGRLSKADRLRALSTVAETHAGEPAAARELGFDALALGYPGHAYHQLLRAAEARPFEPSTYLALAEAAAEAGNLQLAWIWFEVALGGQWSGRFGDFRQIASVTCLHWLRENASDLPNAAAERLRGLAGQIAAEAGFAEADIVVFVQWSTDRTDVDLHVLEPGGERCYYGHKTTAQGGRISTDVTQGLGPEMYVLPQAGPGDYGIGVNYFASDRNKTELRTRVHATVFRNFGRPTEQLERRALTLEDAGGMRDIGILTIE
ncbi:hypothetical protein [Engelhardtia mirabilis]|uniref:VIT domain-containing protein n=1 Tax=Engelhardtia mirabilis TaxID=2528011 RepID=A0A518BS82_9BACT|nr:hypothetical protein Pla133_49500 [Planctomycetes bacterium Pla133]QDV04154.1 hypothetical protein Pla86_49480 [Planctomycetes bacterium Pla86]